MSPAQVVLGRLVAGALALAAVLAVTGQRLPPPGPVWRHLVVVALLLLCVAALVLLPAERLTRRAVAGRTAGALGVLLVLGDDVGEPIDGVGPVAHAACLLATAYYGVAFVVLRRSVVPLGLPAVTVAAAQVALATAVLLLAPWVADGDVELTPRPVFGVLALGVLGTGAAYVWNTNVVTQWGATSASTVTYLTPVVGVLLGAVALGERVAAHQVLSGVLVVLGIAVAQGRLARAVRRPWRRRSIRARPSGHPAGPADEEAQV